MDSNNRLTRAQFNISNSHSIGIEVLVFRESLGVRTGGNQRDEGKQK